MKLQTMIWLVGEKESFKYEGEYYTLKGRDAVKKKRIEKVRVIATLLALLCSFGVYKFYGEERWFGSIGIIVILGIQLLSWIAHVLWFPSNINELL